MDTKVNDQEKPVIEVNLRGEDGNSYWLILKALAALVNRDRMSEAVILYMMTLARITSYEKKNNASGAYEDLKALLGQYVTFVDISDKTEE